MDEYLKSVFQKAEKLAEDLSVLIPEYVEIEWDRTYAASWRFYNVRGYYHPIEHLDSIQLDDLLEIDKQKQILYDNTELFCRGLPANHALLWGARGNGKSSLIHALLNKFAERGLRLVEVDKNYLCEVATLASNLVRQPYKFIVFCDDLSFDEFDFSYKDLKSALEGSTFAVAKNVLIYVTSNRRHLITELHRDNQSNGNVEIHEREAVEERISLSDRFGIWLSFHPFNQDQYLQVVQHWLGSVSKAYQLECNMDDRVRREALTWALNRGVRSGRTAQQFAQHWIGKQLLANSPST